ncbi:MAG: penicillin-binding protein 2 [Nitrospirae bacterium]|nr:penicillin-binding protein 2 [Nitrospirota bacterium]
MAESVRRRLRLVTAIVAACFVVVAGRAFTLAFLTDTGLVDRVRRQQGDVIELAPRRGKILDRNGTLLALSRRMVSVSAHPRKVVDKVGTARFLAPLVGQSPAEVLRELRKEKSFVWIARQVPPSVRDALDAHPIEGVAVVSEYKRFYPQGSMASQALGFVGLDGVGLEGIELSYDAMLRGKPSTLVITRDGVGNVIYDHVSDAYESEGEGLVLSIDLNVQSLLDQKLNEGIKSSGARRGWAMAMDPATGEILAWSVQPAFDPNAFRQLPAERWKNHPITDALDPGSTLKAVLLTAALETGTFNERARLFCENGEYKFYDRVIHDFKKYGELSFPQVFQLSSNICAAKIGLKVGAKTLYEFIHKFGLGERTGIDLPGEIRGLVSSYRSWTPVDLANISYGQGLAVTPIQMVAAFAVFANGGLSVQPHVGKRVTDGRDRLLREIEFPAPRRVLPAELIARVNRILETVITPEGTGRMAVLEGYRLAGKTGTAQKFDPETGLYSKDDYVASFVGFGPVDAPRAVVLVMLDEPQKSIYGGVVAAPLFRDIMSELLPYLGAYPEMPGVRLS